MAQMKTYQSLGTNIHYWISRTQPNDPWLIFLPGLTADHTLFDDQMASFEKRANCFVWDAPAHGKSRPCALDFKMDDFAHSLHGIFAEEGVCAPVFVGQSLGGYISQMFMELYPGTAAGFISIDSAPLKRIYYPNWEVAFLKHTEGMYRAIPWGMLKSWAGRGVAKTDRARQQMRSFMDSYTKQEYCALAGFGYRILAEAIEAQRPYQIDCPALLLCGEHDAAGDVKKFNRAWTKRDGLPLVWIPGAGHNANVDNPEFVNEQIDTLAARL